MLFPTQGISNRLYSMNLVQNEEQMNSSLFTKFLLPRILGWVRQASWLVVSDILDAKILEYLEQGLAYVRESYGTVVWIALLNQDVAIEATHLVDSEDTDTTE